MDEDIVKNIKNISINDKITQIYYPNCFKHFWENDKNYLFLKKYYNIHLPSFFFSSSQKCLDRILKHKSLAIIIANNSLNYFRGKYKKILTFKNVIFISTSKLMTIHLKKLNIEPIEYPFWNGDINKLKDIPNKGKSIYFYSSGPESSFYGYHILKKIIDENFPNVDVKYCCSCPYKDHTKMALTKFKKYSPNEIESIYKDCFIAVRLTTFDGLSDTVQSLGLLGIKTIWNGGTPSSLKYSTDIDIVNHIKNEMKKIGEKDKETSEKVFNFLNPSNYEYIFNAQTYIDYFNGINNTPIIFK